MKEQKEHILDPTPRKYWDSFPKLDLRQRSLFACDSATQRVINKITQDDYKVGFLLQVIYFTRKRQFFSASHFPLEHIRAARKALALPISESRLIYPADVASRHKRKILKVYDWHTFDGPFKQQLINVAQSLVDKRRRKSDIAYFLLDYCLDQHREVPSYAVIRDIIQAKYHEYESNIGKEIRKRLTDENNAALTQLVNNSEEFLLHRDVKRINQGVRRQDCIMNGDILNRFQKMYVEFYHVIDSMRLTQEATEDLAIWVKQATVPRVKKFRDVDRRNLHLLAYLQYQYFHRSDAAVDAFKKIITSLKNNASTYQNRENERHEKEVLDAAAALTNVTRNSKEIVRKIIEIGNNPTKTDKSKIKEIISLAEAFMLSDFEDVDEKLQRVDDDVKKRRNKLDYYHYIFSQSKTIQGRVGPLLKHLVFDDGTDPHLAEALHSYQKGLSKVTELTSMEFLSTSEQALIFREDEFSSTEKFKILLFIKVFESLKDESLSLKYSYKYRPAESYFIPAEFWRKSKDQILTSTTLMAYRDPVTYLDSIGGAVTELLKEVNNRINENENPYVKFHKDGSWWIDTPATNFSTDQFVSKLLGEDASLSLYQMIHQINSFTNFTDQFEHSTKRFSSEEFKLPHAYAALMSLGTNIGHHQMAKACNGITLKQLRDIESNRFSVSNLKGVNEKIVKLIQSLTLPGIYSDEEGRLHTSSDGRKMVVAVDSLMANFSYKYYGKDKGISANSFIDEQQIFFNVNVLTSSEREAPYMLEGMVESKRTLYPESKFKNKSHLHSTDTHGYTEAIFSAMHFLGITFAPRIKSVQHQTLYAYDSESLKKNSNFRIAPKTKLNRKLIVKRWDDILRLMASIKMNYVSAADIFRKLSSSTKDTELYRAVKEFGRLLKTHFLLHYMNDLDLRQRIEKQLNKVELGQSLSRSIFHGRGKRLYVGAKEDIERVLLCSTILQNIVIAWNYLYLSDYLLSIGDSEQRQAVADGISEGSVISWEHINMLGTYDIDHLEGPVFLASLQQMRNLKLRHSGQKE